MPQKLPGGVTSYRGAQFGDAAPWETDPKHWRLVQTADGGYAAQHTSWTDWIVPIAVGSMFAVGPFLQGGAAAAGAVSGAGASASTSAAGALAPTVPGSYASGLYAAGQFGVPGATTAAGGAGSVLSALKGVGGKVTDFLTSKNGVRDVAGLASILPMLRASGGGGSSPFGDVPETEIADAYALQKRRTMATQPAFDALVSQAYGMSPMRYRGAAPEGYPAAAKEPVSGAYAYRGPSFGSNG